MGGLNYINEDTAFERWCENNYLPILAQAIWKKLFKRFNRSGWCEWVTVDNHTLMAEVQIRREKTFIDYRDKLIKEGLIEYIKGKKGSPNKYKLISLSEKCTFTDEVQNEVQKNTFTSEVQSEVHSEVQSEVHSEDITKQDKTKQDKNNLKEKKKKEKSLPFSFSGVLENDSEGLKTAVLEFICHRENIKKPFASEMQFEKWLKKLKNMGTEETQIAILEQSIIEGWQGIFPLKQPNKQLQPMADISVKKNKFCNYEGRKWDYEKLAELEREYIEKDLGENNS